MTDTTANTFSPGGAEIPGIAAGSAGRTPDSLDNYVTHGADFVLSGDTEVKGGFQKIGTFGKHTILTDEDKFLGGEGTAPMPLQYFLAGTAF